MPIKIDRSDADYGRLTEEVVALIKGMLKRGDKQSDIAACFMVNGGRVCEINTGERFLGNRTAELDQLPPQGPYPSPYDLFKMKQEMWKARTALEEAEDAIRKAMLVIHKVEQR
jgi:hypothetical protein